MSDILCKATGQRSIISISYHLVISLLWGVCHWFNTLFTWPKYDFTIIYILDTNARPVASMCQCSQRDRAILKIKFHTSRSLVVLRVHLLCGNYDTHLPSHPSPNQLIYPSHGVYLKGCILYRSSILWLWEHPLADRILMIWLNWPRLNRRYQQMTSQQYQVDFPFYLQPNPWSQPVSRTFLLSFNLCDGGSVQRRLLTGKAPPPSLANVSHPLQGRGFPFEKQCPNVPRSLTSPAEGIKAGVEYWLLVHCVRSKRSRAPPSSCLPSGTPRRLQSGPFTPWG